MGLQTDCKKEDYNNFITSHIGVIAKKIILVEIQFILCFIGKDMFHRMYI